MIAVSVRFIWLQSASGLYDCKLRQVCIIAICVRFVLLQFASGLYNYKLRQVYLIAICVRFVLLQFASGLYDCKLRRCSRVQFKLTMFEFYWTSWNIFIFIYLLNMILALSLAILNTRFIYRVSCKTWSCLNIGNTGCARGSETLNLGRMFHICGFLNSQNIFIF